MSQKDTKDVGLEKILEEEMSLFIPRDCIRGIESDGKAGPMQSVSQNFMVRVDNV